MSIVNNQEIEQPNNQAMIEPLCTTVHAIPELKYTIFEFNNYIDILTYINKNQ